MSKRKLGIVDTMAQAAALLGRDKKELKWAKKSGCRAFVGSSRVDCDKLVKWFAERDANNPNADPIMKELPALEVEERKANLRLKLSRADKVDHETAVAKRQVVKVHEMDETYDAVSKILSGLLRSKFIVELPPRCAGAGEIEIREHNTRAVTEILRQIHDRATWYRTEQ